MHEVLQLIHAAVAFTLLVWAIGSAMAKLAAIPAYHGSFAFAFAFS